jgi:hypothetical protein
MPLRFAANVSQIRGCRKVRAPEHKGAIAQQSGAYVEESARTGRPAQSDRIDVTGFTPVTGFCGYPTYPRYPQMVVGVTIQLLLSGATTRDHIRI